MNIITFGNGKTALQHRVNLADLDDSDDIPITFGPKFRPTVASSSHASTAAAGRRSAGVPVREAASSAVTLSRRSELATAGDEDEAGPDNYVVALPQRVVVQGDGESEMTAETKLIQTAADSIVEYVRRMAAEAEPLTFEKDVLAASHLTTAFSKVEAEGLPETKAGEDLAAEVAGIVRRTESSIPDVIPEGSTATKPRELLGQKGLISVAQGTGAKREAM